jgi:hypothetical protein
MKSYWTADFEATHPSGIARLSQVPSLVGLIWTAEYLYQARTSRYTSSISLIHYSSPKRWGPIFFAKIMVSLEQLKPQLELTFYLITFLSLLWFVGPLFWFLGVEDCTVTPTSTPGQPSIRYQLVAPLPTPHAPNIRLLCRILHKILHFFTIWTFWGWPTWEINSNPKRRRPPPRRRRRSCLNSSNPKPQPSILSENLTRSAFSVCQSPRPLGF